MKIAQRMVQWLGLVAGFACVILATPAAANLVTVTYQGTVSGGWDWAGTFGAANTDLAGQSFTAVYNFDTAAGDRGTDEGYDVVYGGSGYGIESPLVSASLTIGSGMFTNSGNYVGEIYVHTLEIHSYAGYDDGSEYGIMYHSIYTASASPDINALHSATGTGYGTGYSFNNVTNRWNWMLNFSPTSVVVTNTAVPEPGTLAMMLGGVGLLGIARRRKSVVSGSVA